MKKFVLGKTIGIEYKNGNITLHKVCEKVNLKINARWNLPSLDMFTDSGYVRIYGIMPDECPYILEQIKGNGCIVGI